MTTRTDSNVDPQFTIGDRVVVHNKKGTAVHGVVRWTGNHTTSREFNCRVIGIETVKLHIKYIGLYSLVLYTHSRYFCSG